MFDPNINDFPSDTGTQEEETLWTLPAEVTVPLVLQRHLLLSLGLQLCPASPVVDLSEMKAGQTEPLSRHN